jgi:DNA-binding LacI/PurR family transcriptional regulator
MKQKEPGKQCTEQLRAAMEAQYKRLSLSEPRGLNTPYMEILDKVTFCTGYTPLFKDHADSEVWVFSSDAEAARAITWARSRGIKVPAQLGVISLENNPAYYHLGLSYCGPDWENIGYMMAHAVIGDFPLPKTSRGFVRTQALLLEKQTTI